MLKVEKGIKKEIKKAMRGEVALRWKVVKEWGGYTLVLHDTGIYTGIPSKEDAILLKDKLEWFIRTSRDI